MKILIRLFYELHNRWDAPINILTQDSFHLKKPYFFKKIMRIILFRFEKENINFLECTINSGSLVIGKKEKVSLVSTENRGEKYNKVLDELLQIHTKYSPDIFAYQSPQKYRWAIKDEESFANSSILHLFCHQNTIKLLELTPVIVRNKLSIPLKEFKILLEEEKNEIIKNYEITKTDKLLDGLVFLSILKSII